MLTGLDYWLDNLMCNVPEVVMCFHMDGIVQVIERNFQFMIHRMFTYTDVLTFLISLE